MQTRSLRPFGLLAILLGLLSVLSTQPVNAQSSQAAIEWGLFNGILIVGIIVGIIVFGLLFYAIIRYREKPSMSGVAK